MTFSLVKKTSADTWDAVRKKPTILIVPSIVELVFSVAASVVIAILQLKILRNLYEIFQLVDLREIAAIPVSQLSDQAALFDLFRNQAEFMGYYTNIIKLLITLLVSLYIIWTLFQSINWWLAQREKRIKYSTFLARFATVTVAWAVLAAIFFVISIKLLMFAAISAAISTNTATIIVAILYVILSYIAFTSYTIAHKHKIKHLFQKTFKLAYKKFPQLATMFIAGLIPTLIIGTLVYTLAKTQPWMGAVAFILLIPPYNFMKKIFYLKTVKRLPGKT